MSEAEQIYREACWAFLNACFIGAPPAVLKILAEAMFATRPH